MSAISIPQRTCLVVKCSGCAGSYWKYTVSYSTDVATGARTRTFSEIRCGQCNKKASRAEESSVRDTDEFQKAYSKENEHL